MRKGGLAAWSIRHPVSTIMLMAAAMILGLFALGRLSTDLLPHLIYPQIGVRVLDPGVSPAVMEDKITRQLEEQLAITEDVITVESTTSEGRSSVNLNFEYGKDIDNAVRDASTRLDRARRFLPTTIEPPIIFKFDPAQIPVMTYVVTSPLRPLVELRTWTDDEFSKQFLSLPGVAAVEVGGGVVREIHVLLDQRRLAGLGLSMDDVIDAIKSGNEDSPAGRLVVGNREYTSRTAGRLNSIAAIASLPVRLSTGESIPLAEVAQVVDAHEDQRLHVRFDDIPGVKVSIQKQPTANTVNVADRVKARLAWLRANGLIPEDIRVNQVSDQSVFIRRSLNNATLAAVSGAVLAMLVVYLFLGNVRGTLIIGSAIPISIMVTFIVMALGDLTLNVMTLGGLALGVGMLIDNTIVMLENISRHKQEHMGVARLGTHKSGARSASVDSDAGPDLHNGLETATQAAAEVNSAIVASTTTNLAAVLPFLFIGGLIGLLFRELIFTISAAIVGSLVVALTLVPSLAARMSGAARGGLHSAVDRLMVRAQSGYGRLLERVLRVPGWVMAGALVLLVSAFVATFLSSKQEFLPGMDDGQVRIRVLSDPGMSLEAMNQQVRTIENLIRAQPYVDSIYTVVGGWIFGRTQYERSNKSSITVQLAARSRRDMDSNAWVKQFTRAVEQAPLAGVKVRPRTSGIRGLRTSRSGEEVSVRVRGPDLATLAGLGADLVSRLEGVAGLRNVRHSAEDIHQELAVTVDRRRAPEFGIDIADVGRALRIALAGVVVSDFVDGDRSYDIRVRLPQGEVDSPAAMRGILLFGESSARPAVYLRDVARIALVPTPTEIRRDSQSRIIEVSGSLTGERTLGEVMKDVKKVLAHEQLPPGYGLYYAGADESLKRGRETVNLLLGLALFLVYVVMAVQYESLRNPAVILLSVPFALVGVTLGLFATGLPLSMAVWLGVIMLIGIVVNNAIVLVEFIELMRARGRAVGQAILAGAQLRLRPILMTTITTVVGMLPLALGLGEGSEMLQPLAVTIVAGLSFSMLVSLILVPAMYVMLHRRDVAVTAAAKVP